MRREDGFGPVVVVLLGAGMLAGGLWVRKGVQTARERAVAGGVAAAGAAILLVAVLVILFLMPTSVSPQPVSNPVVDAQTAA